MDELNRMIRAAEDNNEFPGKETRLFIPRPSLLMILDMAIQAAELNRADFPREDQESLNVMTDDLVRVSDWVKAHHDEDSDVFVGLRLVPDSEE